MKDMRLHAMSFNSVMKDDVAHEHVRLEGGGEEEEKGGGA